MPASPPPPWMADLWQRMRRLFPLKLVGTTAFTWVFFLGYFHLLRFPRQAPFTMPLTALDALIPFQPVMLVPYLSLWFYVGVAPGLQPNFRELAVYGAWVSAGSFLWYFYSNSDFAVVGRLEGPVVLGYYSLAFQLMSLPVQKVTANLNQVTFPVFCRLQGEPERVKRWFLRMTTVKFIS